MDGDGIFFYKYRIAELHSAPCWIAIIDCDPNQGPFVNIYYRIFSDETL